NDEPVNDEPVNDEPVNDEPVNDESGDSIEPAAEVDDVAEVEDIEVAEASVPRPATSASPAPTATAVLTHVVRSIVDDADAVQVDAVEGRNRLKLEVKVGPGDLGRVIGRRGRTAQSIRTVVRAAATRDGVEVDVDFVD
ncbi:MAG: KH domain-containing protein, partial [Ilumatobacteraceae bacterium]